MKRKTMKIMQFSTGILYINSFVKWITIFLIMATPLVSITFLHIYLEEKYNHEFLQLFTFSAFILTSGLLLFLLAPRLFDKIHTIDPLSAFEVGLETDIGSMKKLTQVTPNRIEKIDDILQLSEKIYKTLRKIRWKLWFGVFLDREGRGALRESYETGTAGIYKRLVELRMDLNVGLESQKELIETTKKILKNNIGNNTELNRISELQSKRLDQQISQYNNLQSKL